MTNGNRTVGAYGEELAARYLRDIGLEIIERNWRCEVGEIDIVAADPRTLVVCEVKTRRTEAFGSAIEAVTPAKAHRLRQLAGCWIEAHPQQRRADVRVDVIGILRPAAGPARITHLRGVGA